jgi:hypothetical protein
VFEMALQLTIESAASTHQYEFGVFVNGTLVPKIQFQQDFVVSTGNINVAATGLLSLSLSDVVDIRVQCLDAAGTTLDITWGNFNIVSIGGTTGASAPTLDAIGSPYLASEAGGGATVTLTGTNLATVTNLTVGGSPASGVTSTSTSVSFTWPALASNTSAYDIQVTTPSGNTTLHGAVFVLPVSVKYCWYAAYGFDGSTGYWTDQFQGCVNNTVYNVGFSTWHTTSSWSNGQPALTIAFGGQQLQATITTTTVPYAYFMVGSISTSTTGTCFLTGDASFVGSMLCNGSSNWTGFAGYGGSYITTSATDCSSPFLGEMYVDGASSYMQFNGSKTMGSLGTGTSSTLSFGFNVGGNTMDGSLALILVAESPTSGDETIIHAISQAIYGTP